MRSLLQFLGAASSALCAILLTGTLLTSIGRAEDKPPGTGDLVSGNCQNCCACGGFGMPCLWSPVGRNCDGSFDCNQCTCKMSGQGFFICSG